MPVVTGDPGAVQSGPGFANSAPVGTGNTGPSRGAMASGSQTDPHSHPVHGGSPVAASSSFQSSVGTPLPSLPPSVDCTPGGSVRERVANYQLGN